MAILNLRGLFHIDIMRKITANVLFRALSAILLCNTAKLLFHSKAFANVRSYLIFKVNVRNLYKKHVVHNGCQT